MEGYTLLMRKHSLVNNAGISVEAGNTPKKVHETPEDTWDLTMAVNAKSVFLGCKYACAQMIKQEASPSGDRGWIINISSIYGLVGGYYTCECPLF
jgi:NAD(P)-dependent dehydrogenase (short-subunit alcohol dehydrogenase family)